MLCCTIMQIQAEETIIKGKVKEIKKGRLHILARTGEEKTDTLGSCEVKKGKFVVSPCLPSPVKHTPHS